MRYGVNQHLTTKGVIVLMENLAADQNGCTWKYIEGIYKKFAECRIETVEDAIEREYAWQRGEIPA